MIARALPARSYSGVGVAVSVVSHAALALALARGGSGHETPKRLPSVNVAVVAAVPARPPEPEKPPPPDKLAEQPAPRVAKTTRAPRLEAREPEPAASPAPVDLSGVTLTNAGPGERFTMQAGNGLASAGPLVAPSGRTGAAAHPEEPGPPTVPNEVPARDLGRRPVPPALDSLLQSHYPADARRRGMAGSAVVRVRIDPDGRARHASIVSESGSGFGAACQKTVKGSRWSPPLDRAGRLVATNVTYACRFQVEN